MKNVILLEEEELNKICSMVEQIDVSLGSLFNSGIENEKIKESLKNINCYNEILGKIFRVWED